MALLESIHIPLKTKMTEFNLVDPFGKAYNGRNLYGENGLLINFTCNHCPYAIAVWPRFIQLARYARQLKINTVAINPNINPDYPDDSPQSMIKRIKEWGIDFPYLIDETQSTARSFKAQCTPDLYLFNANQELVYHGRIDDSWQDANKVRREELKEAITDLASGRAVSSDQKSSMGCSIKWLGNNLSI